MSKVEFSGDLRRGLSAELPKVIKPALKGRGVYSAELSSAGEPVDPSRSHQTPGKSPLTTRFSGDLNDMKDDGHSVIEMDHSGMTTPSPGRNHSNSPWLMSSGSPSPAAGPNPWNMNDILRAARGDSSSSYLLGKDDEQEQMVEVMLDVGQDGVMLRSVMPRDNAPPPIMSHTEATKLVEGLHRQSSSLQKQPSMGLKHTASLKVKQISQELKRLSRNGSRVLSVKYSPDFDPLVSIDSTLQPPSAPSSAGGPGPGGPRRPLTRSASSAEQALHGLRFIHKATGTADQQSLWEAVKERFHKLKNDEGMLPRANFCVCIGKSFPLEPENWIVPSQGVDCLSIPLRVFNFACQGFSRISLVMMLNTPPTAILTVP